jgi:hypothetical protein
MVLRVISGFLLILLLTGCQTLSERRQSESLQEVLRKYEGVIRWGGVDQASRFLRPDAMSEAGTSSAEEARVTHYEVIQGPSIVEENRAIQTAIIQYVFVNSQVVREILNQQTWEFDPESGNWYLISPLPTLK